MLQAKVLKDSDTFFVNDGNLEATRDIKLTVEFLKNSYQSRMNDISMYFKQFVTFLLASHPSIAILNWEKPKQNPVTKAIDISPNEQSNNQYFSGMVVQANRQKIKGFVKI